MSKPYGGKETLLQSMTYKKRCFLLSTCRQDNSYASY